VLSFVDFAISFRRNALNSAETGRCKRPRDETRLLKLPYTDSQPLSTARPVFRHAGNNPTTTGETLRRSVAPSLSVSIDITTPSSPPIMTERAYSFCRAAVADCRLLQRPDLRYYFAQGRRQARRHEATPYTNLGISPPHSSVGLSKGMWRL
jgi:hypothetical protein